MKKKITLKAEIAFIAMIPMVLVAVLLLITSDLQLGNAINKGEKSLLHACALMARDEAERAQAAGVGYDFVDTLKQSVDVDLTIFEGDTRVATSILKEDGSRLTGTKASDAVIADVLRNGKEYFATDVVINGEKYYGYYVPIHGEDSTITGMAFSGKPQADARNTSRSAILLMVICTLVTVAVVCVIAVLMARSMAASMNGSVQAIDDIAAGKFDASVSDRALARTDEIGELARAARKLGSDLGAAVAAVKSEGGNIAEAAPQLAGLADSVAATVEQAATAVDGVAKGATDLAQNAQDASDKSIKMGEAIERTTKDTGHMSTAADATERSLKEIKQALTELNDVNRVSNESLQKVLEETKILSDSIEGINEAVQIIEQVADETKLLSLNASIEAARAGDAGKGFAVVAGQIQSLAAQTDTSTKEITKVINHILSVMADSEAATSALSTAKEHQDTCLDSVSASLKDLLARTDELTRSIADVREAVDTVEGLRAGLVDIISGLAAIAEENAASSEEISASIEEIAGMASNVSDSAKSVGTVSDKLGEALSVWN